MFGLNTAKLLGVSAVNMHMQGANMQQINASLTQSSTSLDTDYNIPLLDDFIGQAGKSQLSINNLYRDMYIYDSVAGPAVDLISNLPFSEFSLTGVTDPKILEIYESSLNELSIMEMMQQITVSYLVLGKVISSLLFDSTRGIFTDNVIHNPDNCEILPIPLSGYDPKINLKVDSTIQKFLRSRDTRDLEAQSEIPNELRVQLMKGGKIPLEPLNTLYISRNVVPGVDSISYYSRILPMWLIEKALIRGTIIGAWRRQRSILHVTCLTGDTLVSVNGKLIRIDKICSKQNLNKHDSIDVDFVTKGKNGRNIKVTKWIYQGKDYVKKIKTKTGYSIKATDNHRFLVLSKNCIIWKKLKDILLSDSLCVNNHKITEGNIFDSIISIDQLQDKQHVYDLTIDKDYAPFFIANGIVVHNCGNEEWEPSPQQLGEIAQLFNSADQDPQGAIAVTRQGIETSEIRDGSNFWRVSDDWDVLSNAKMRALGISEAFLSGDASYNCYHEDTYVPTEKGLIKIKNIGKLFNITKPKKNKAYDINLKVGTKLKPKKAKIWIYTGKSPILNIETKAGNKIACTPNNPLLVLRKGKLKLEEAKQLQLGDYLCFNPDQYINTKKLKLNLKQSVKRGKGYKKLKTIKYMNPKFAYLLGLIASEGVIDKKKGRYCFSFSNSNPILLDVYDKLVYDCLGLKTTRRITNYEGTKVNILSRECNCNFNCCQTLSYSKTAVNWFDELGMYTEGNKTKTASYYVKIPWAILQADNKSKYAFLAAYIEGDGSISDGRIRISSASKDLIKTIQILLNSLGIFCSISQPCSCLSSQPCLTINVTGIYGKILYDRIEPYLNTKKVKWTVKSVSKIDSIPIDWLKTRIKSKVIGNDNRGKKNLKFKTKTGIVEVKNWTIANPFIRNKSFLRCSINNFDDKLKDLKAIDKVGYNRFKKLINSNYIFTPIINITKGKKAHTYDFSMKSKKNPTFIVNGLVGGNTVDVALSVFIENLKAYRNFITHKIFYEKIFLLLAKFHKFKKRTAAELNHNVRTNGYERTYIKLSAAKETRESKQYNIPEINWFKQLTPSSDQQMIDMLTMAEEKGIPIPLRMYAVAAGVGMDKVLENLEDDLKIREQIIKHNKKLKELEPKGEEGEEGGGGEGDMWGKVKTQPNKIMELSKAIPNEVILTGKEAGSMMQSISNSKGSGKI